MALHFYTFADLSIICLLLLLSFLPRDGPPAYLAFTLVFGRLFRWLENLPVLVLA